MDERFYDRGQKLNVALVNKAQILFVPILGARIISDAAEIYDWPLTKEEIGERIFLYFRQMADEALPIYEPYKKYWLLPRKIRSYKQFVQATSLISLELDGDRIKLVRWYPDPVPSRGFEKLANEYDDIISATVSAKELGEFVFNHIEK